MFQMSVFDVSVYSGPWGRHVREYWEHRNDGNILFLQFEKLIQVGWHFSKSFSARRL